MSVTKKLILDIFSLFAVQMVNYVLPVLMIPFLISKSSIASYGEIAVFQSIILLSITVIDYGFSFTATKAIAESCSNKKNYQVLVNVSVVKLVMFLILLPFIVFYTNSLNNKIFSSISIIIIFSNIFQFNWFFQGIGKISSISKITTLSKFATTLPCFLLIKNSDDLYLFLMSMLAGNIFISISSFFYLKKNIEVGKIEFDVTGYMKEGFFIFLSRLSVISYTALIPIAIGHLMGNYIVGIYSGIDRIIKGVSSLQSPFIQAAYPFIIKNPTLKNHINSIYLLPLIAYVLFGVMSQFFYEIPLTLFNLPITKESIFIYRLLSFLPILTSISGYMGVCVLLAKGKNLVFSVCIFSGSLYSLFSLSLVYYIEIRSVNFISSIAFASEFIVCLFMLLFVCFRISK